MLYVCPAVTFKSMILGSVVELPALTTHEPAKFPQAVYTKIPDQVAVGVSVILMAPFAVGLYA